VLLIDAYNVLHVTGVLPPHLAGVEVDGLASLIDASRYARRRTLLVCDGTGGAAGASIKRAVRRAVRERGDSQERVRVLYAGPGAEADALIESLLGRYGGKTTLVVSSDRRVLKAARVARARSLTSEKFLRQLVADEGARPGGRAGPAGKPDGPVGPGQARDWARQMGIAPDDPVWSIVASEVPTPRSRVDAKRVDTPAQQPGADRPSRPRPDPLILEALKEWPGRLELDDLDMSKWLAGDVEVSSSRTSEEDP
jgi:hypothetical protein